MNHVLQAVFAPGFFTSQTVSTALIVGSFVAFVTGIVGIFTVTRGQSFAGHALADLGAVGGSGAFLVGISQLWGFVGAGIIAAILMELVGIKRLQGRDVATGIVFGFGLGLTALFLYWDTTVANTSNAAISVLFGSLFVIDTSLVPLVVALSIVAILLIVAIYRWLLLEAVNQDMAAIRGVPVRLTGLVFLIALALAVELSSLTIGAILSTALLIGPAAIALRLTKRIGVAAVTAGLIGVAATVAGIVISYDSYYWFGNKTNWPVSFCIVAVIFLAFVLSAAISAGRRQARHDRRAPVAAETAPVS
jgi:zinc/manganese transport system permease protein